MKITVDKKTCIGCVACVAICPDYFDMDGDKAKPKKSEFKEIGCAQDAADGCPVQAIKIK